MAKDKAEKKVVLTEAQKQTAKKDAFERLIKPRVDKLSKAAQAVRQCVSANYVSTDAQKRAVVVACKVEFDAITTAYEGKGGSIGGFTLPKE